MINTIINLALMSIVVIGVLGTAAFFVYDLWRNDE